MPEKSDIARRLVKAAARPRDEVGQLQFAPPVTHVYNPLDYAWESHRQYLERYASERKRVVFLGMNPGPFGMAQTGVPFGEVAAVRDWLGILAPIGTPRRQHPKRPIAGFGCQRSEISGQRLWGLFAARFGTAPKFFAEHFVANYCPLAFMEEGGANRTPEKLPANEREPLFALCDRHLRALVSALEPEWLVAIGDFAMKRALHVLPGAAPRLVRILHPSPASPAANREWAAIVTRDLERHGIW